MLGMSSLLFLLAYPHKKNKGRGQTWGNEFKKKKILFGCKKNRGCFVAILRLEVVQIRKPERITSEDTQREW